MENRKIRKILVVDDDPVQVRLMEKVLTGEGFEVVTALEAAEGLQYAMTSSPDLIILDVMMPIINGFNFCKLLKNEELQSKIAIILVTARSEKEDIQIGLDMGADAYLCKPVQTHELLKTISVVEKNSGA
jgi:DNA-binding response OmpR family regulator